MRRRGMQVVMWVENVLKKNVLENENILLDIILKVIFFQFFSQEEVDAVEDEVQDTIFSEHCDYDSE